ncbi:hypothetical protein Salat_1654800 [Sesamum alatum]|uniref:Reverse transcriptase zinc-binding domain-containing protein n=1 Tax=Sesamum alatum TaxID=300844 RepID=A0AAE1Y6Z8_9LAMI|nr:hypothetical protein Salat_1654800 [Sesamum alatum]
MYPTPNLSSPGQRSPRPVNPSSIGPIASNQRLEGLVSSKPNRQSPLLLFHQYSSPSPNLIDLNIPIPNLESPNRYTTQSVSPKPHHPIPPRVGGPTVRGVRRRGRILPANRGGRGALKRKGVWRLTKNGVFTVRSAYKVAVELGNSRVASTSCVQPFSIDDDRGFCKKLWSSITPPRVRLQAWKFCYNAIMTLENLARRKPEVDSRCALCLTAPEAIKHVLLECHYSRVVWALSNILWELISEWSGNVADWFLRICGQPEK